MSGEMMELTSGEIFLRLGAAVFLGGLIGLNRELHRKPAGLRTHAMVALGAALVAVYAQKPVGAGAVDANALSRVIQGILTGIGFLGAGVILRSEDGQHVQGLTTAATVWLVATLGVGCGLGYWSAILPAAIFAFLILLSGGYVEKKVHYRLHPEDAKPGFGHPPENKPE
jgi:putative Mg2+ transporter-C (MgtC) family protein